MCRLTFALAAVLTVCSLIVAQNSLRETTKPVSSAVTSDPSGPTPVSMSRTRAGSLCGADEQVIFNCAVGGQKKLVSLCGSGKLDRQRGYLQYRFGRAGKIELEFPKERRETQAAFKFSRYTRPLVTYLRLRFEVNGHTYEIYDDSNDEEGTKGQSAGITVTPPGTDRKQTEMRCRMPVLSHLATLEDVVPNFEFLN
jgi:hypothetical protein